MCQHLADNVQRTMQHAIEVEEKIPLDQVRLSVVYLLGGSSMLYSQKFLRVQIFMNVQKHIRLVQQIGKTHLLRPMPHVLLSLCG